MKLSELTPGMKLALNGKSQKGKSRIGQHGKIWTVIRKTMPGISGNVLLRSENETFKNDDGTWSHDMRWIWIPNDRNFDIMEVITDG